LAPCDIIRGSAWWRSTRPVSFFLSICFLVTNQFAPVEKMKPHKGRIISEDDADIRLVPMRISLDWCPTKGEQM
jgi:hypothetical protein